MTDDFAGYIILTGECGRELYREGGKEGGGVVLMFEAARPGQLSILMDDFTYYHMYG